MNLFQFHRKKSCIQVAISIFVTSIFFSLLPFASALDVHHIFAEVDHDGHEHSDFDLCQWVKANGSGSVDFDHIDINIPLQVDKKRWFVPKTVYSSVTFTLQESRGPPLFF